MPSLLSDVRADLNRYTGGRTFICYDPAPSPGRHLSMKMKVSRALRTSRGFTLIEIMVVVVIIGLLAAVIVPAVVNRVDEERGTRAKADIAAIESALVIFRLDNSKYPTTEQGLAALTTQPTDPSIRNWRPG